MDHLHDIEDDGEAECLQCEQPVDIDDLDEEWICKSCRLNAEERRQDTSDYRSRVL